MRMAGGKQWDINPMQVVRSHHHHDRMTAVMPVIDAHIDDRTSDANQDPLGATTSELSEELIFLIASAATDDQRKQATELFRYFSRKLEDEAYRRGQDSVAPRQLPAPAMPLALEAPTIQPTEQASDEVQVSLIPQVRWLR
ncbi:hypothetical protein [Tardiphaga sp.]|jgi:hypothetical protein|uniref:hypothetical protein n=1 Tax=Tardiphaga sp. TaxID=1926292 RepID=UPI0037DA4C7C